RSPIHRPGEDADGLLVILDGVAREARAPGPGIVAPGAVLGALELLAERPYASALDAVTAVRALRLPRAALFDVMEDHTDFAIALLGRLAGELLDLARPQEVN
ncbi:MAG TPA: cyclic nucleotide-binding domain-containing protein, partial [Kofleriaceae bacterium]|nr:cyclic nucleotide-binding domain-containing protein [Kofleriaceae bacterium]